MIDEVKILILNFLKSKEKKLEKKKQEWLSSLSDLRQLAVLDDLEMVS